MRHLKSTVLAAVLLVAMAAAATGETLSGEVQEDDRLAGLIARVESAIPNSWRIVETGTAQTPIGWSGREDGLYVMVEDTSTRFFHPNGFHYYSFYRLWLMPPDWEGEMRVTPYVSDSVPAYLLGVNDDYAAFYHSAGGNVWEEGPRALCTALGLDRICLTNLSRRVVDLEFDERLRNHIERLEEEAERALVLSPQYIIGLDGAGPNLYMEYVLTEDVDIEEEQGLMVLTELLASDVFSSFPEIESLYVRRCSSDAFTDTIVIRD